MDFGKNSWNCEMNIAAYCMRQANNAVMKGKVVNHFPSCLLMVLFFKESQSDSLIHVLIKHILLFFLSLLGSHSVFQKCDLQDNHVSHLY